MSNPNNPKSQHPPDVDIKLSLSNATLDQLAKGGTLRISETGRKFHVHVSSQGEGPHSGSMSRRRPWRWLIAAALAGLVMASLYAHADNTNETPVPRLLPYEGVLEMDGVPVNGAVAIAFSLYTTPSADAGAVWSELQEEVQIAEGRFAVVLGEEGGNPIPQPALESPELYLGMSVNGVPLSNRQRLATGLKTAHSTPVGSVVAFAGQVPPRGWLLCNGESVSRTTYHALFAAIGTTHGAVDGDRFSLPDFRGRFLRGVDGGAGRDPDAASRQGTATGGASGDQVGSVQGGSTALPNSSFVTGDNNRGHTHNFAVYRSSFAGGGGSASLYTGHPFGENRTTTDASQTHTHTVVSGGDNETRPVNAGVHWIIKY